MGATLSESIKEVMKRHVNVLNVPDHFLLGHVSLIESHIDSCRHTCDKLVSHHFTSYLYI